ncbi:MAG: molybdopterin-guanine dinucleotide biosynthesis protein A [Paracoccaceae bacterium]|jgi:molybdopterin-guanine dinucleotide biosynthesis protein A
MTRVIGVVLAGGQARRMGGGDKGALLLGGETMLARVIARLAPQVESIVLNANGDPARFADYGLPVVADSIAEYPGPLAGVLAGLDHAATVGASHVISAAADTPFFPRDLAGRLAEGAATQAHPIALAATHEEGRTMRHPTFGLWPVALREDLRAALNDGLRKVVLWTDRHGAAQVVFPAGTFFNINAPEDLAAAHARLEEDAT